MLVMPKSVDAALVGRIGGSRIVLGHGQSTDRSGWRLIAVPMYNLPNTPDAPHPKGWGNGYVLDLGGRRVYISGDTQGTPEMRDLSNIDLAFVCMNLPYTMDVARLRTPLPT
ncbi:MBL fold metallo-hydrolase [Salinisphaera sp.]|uniref:MBL fold metallo-hydrolase n=1 Tax=Salinisphaera sp. TaxID=1914330 RepID=UPI003C7DA49F